MLALPVLEEGRGPLGPFLWRMLRAIDAWAATPAALRDGLFSAEGARDRAAELLAGRPDDELARWGQALLRVLTAPTEIEPGDVARACTGMAGWTAEANRPVAAAAFTHAAALACPGSAPYALASARAYRTLGSYAEAEAMFQRALAVARQARDWDTYVRAHAGLGVLAQYRGAWPAARRATQRALRAAERHGIRDQRPGLLHDLFTVENACGNNMLAEEYAMQAALGYGAEHPNLVRLAGDVGIYWTRVGRFREALDVFLRVEPRLAGLERALILGNIARAAGVLGDRGRWTWAWQKLEIEPSQSLHWRSSMLDVAFGAVALEEWDIGEELAAMVLPDARIHRQHQLAGEAQALLDEIATERKLAARRQPPAQSQQAAGVPEDVAPTPLFSCLDRVLAPAGAA